MSSVNTKQSFSETKQDFKTSWNLLKESWKAFISTIIFAALCLFLITSILFIMANFIPSFFIPNLTRDFSNFFTRLIYFLSFFSINFIAVLVFFAFLSCQYGLAYDIMSSGDMFAEFKGSFTYFRQHWWQYSILAILIFWSLFFIAGRGPFFPLDVNLLFILINNFTKSEFPRYLGPILGSFLYFFWFILFINTFPSITAQGHNKSQGKFSKLTKFKDCFIENFNIFRNYPKRIFLTWGIYFLIFYFPLVICIAITYLIYNSITYSILLQILQIIVPLLLGVLVFVGTPLMALIATRIYNSVKIEGFRTVDKIKENTNFSSKK